MITETTIFDNYKELLSIIDTKIVSDRKVKLLEFYNEHRDVIMMQPASGKKHYHGCYPGGYVVHVLNVIKMAEKLKFMWDKCGIDINFTDEEMYMVAINHDLGKIGNGIETNYIQSDNDWRIRNLGEYYTSNNEIPYMVTSDRSLYMMQKMGVELTENEWIGIKIHDGMFVDSNKSYYINYDANVKIKTNLVYVINHADYMAMLLEKQLENGGVV